MTAQPAEDAERFLTFEAESSVYALPIAEIHEVAEATQICCVPTISPLLVGVMNWNGDALPVVSTPLLLANAEEVSEPDGEADDDAAVSRDEKASETRRGLGRTHVLVVSSRDDEAAQLGLPIDRVMGLVDGPRHSRSGAELVVETRLLEGCSVNVLNPRRLVERATEVIDRVT